jgi:hypothetical protein
MWNDLRILHGIGSALIECESRSVLSGKLPTELQTTVAKSGSDGQQKWRKQLGA